MNLPSSEGRVVRAAVVQAAPVPFDVPATLRKVEQLATRAAEGGTELVVFPEAFVSCYPYGSRFGAVIGGRTAEGKTWFRRYFSAAIAVPGPATTRIGEIARTLGIHLVIGVIERDGGTLYCTALTFGPAGRLLGKHRKLMPTVAERLVWGYGDGSTLPVYDTPIGKIGTVICWENYMPLMRMSMYAKGVELYCAPTADDLDSWVASMRHVAKEGRCFVLSANQYVRRSDFPADYPVDTPLADAEVFSVGNSVIVSPYGEILAGPDTSGETILRAELHFNQLLESKYEFDPVGHYSRPDVFSMRVNETPNRPVHFD